MLEILKDQNGKYSFSRVWCSILMVLYVFSSVYSLIKFSRFPDVPLQLAGLISALYGINKFGTKNTPMQ